MSLVYKTKVVPAVAETTKKYVAGVKCELCPRKGQGEEFDGGGDYSDVSYEMLEVNVHLEEGSNYPEGGSASTTVLDICPDCFKSKLVPWFQEQGGTVRNKESDW